MNFEEVIRKNPRERMKLEKFPLDILLEVNQLKEKGYENIPEEDMVRLQWWGLYHDKPRLGYFMLRVKIPNGILKPNQLRAIGEISREYGKNYVELTTRQNIQLHWIRLEDILDVFEKLCSEGLTTVGGCGDIPRNITGCPVAGVSKEELFDSSLTVRELAEFLYGNRDYSNLPRKHKITVSSCIYQCNAPEIHCIALIGVIKDGRKGYTYRIGGGLSSSPRISKHLPIFVDIKDAVRVTKAIIDVWKDNLKYRLSFARARLKFMLDDYSVDQIRTWVEEKLGEKLEDYNIFPKPSYPTAHPHLGLKEQKDGKYYLGIPVLAGLVTGDQIIKLADLVEKFGEDIRITMQQNLIVTGIQNGEKFKEKVKEIGFKLDLPEMKKVSIACTGDPYCNYSVGETKLALIEILNHLEKKGLLLDDIRINLDGCPHACAHHWLGDIGLQGTTLRTPDGVVYAFDILLGGGYASNANIARVVARRVPASLVKFWIENFLRFYLKERREGERVKDFISRYSNEELVRIMSNNDERAKQHIARGG